MKELEYAKIGQRIRQARKAKGWSQEELAKKCGISLNFIGQIERGTRHMSLDTFASLCKELETNADTLLFGTLSFETEIQGVWGQAEKRKTDSYSMYVRIMKSVADILGDMPDREEDCSKDMSGRENYEDHTVI